MKAFTLAITPLLLVTLVAGNTADEKTRNGAQPNIEFGSVRLVAGMPRDQVIASLAESYTISPWKNPEGMDTWGVADRLGDVRGAHPLVGYVSFEAGKLLRAGKYWPQSGSGYDVVHTVSNILAHLHGEGFSKCSLLTRKENQPDRGHDILVINCGFKGISLDASLGHYEGEPVTGVDVYEEIVFASPGKH